MRPIGDHPINGDGDGNGNGDGDGVDLVLDVNPNLNLNKTRARSGLGSSSGQGPRQRQRLRSRVVVLGVLVLLCGTAAADPDLRVRHAPAPQHLVMRRTAAAPSTGPAIAPARAGVRDPARVTVPNPHAAEEDSIGGVGGLRDPNQPVTFQLDAGYAIDGTEAASPSTSLGGRTVTPDADYARIRAYGFGDAYVGTHGVGYAGLQTFFAARLELTKPFQLQTFTGGPTDAPLAPPIADWFSTSNLMIRAVWGELHGISERAWLAPLRVRAGEFYVYGPWVAHIRGALAAWEGKIVTLSAYQGVRAPDYASVDALSLAQATVQGASLRVDLRALTSLPIAITGQFMALGAIDGTPETHHADIDIDWRPRRDIVVRSEARWLDGQLANEHLQLRGRYKQQTNLVFDLQIRSSADWRWDPSLTQQDEVGDARRYLDLGPVVPQVIGSARAGTVLFDNIDILLRGALASEVNTKTDIDTSAYSAPYVEGAAAADIRLRRTITIGASVLTRRTTVSDAKLPAPVVDLAGTPQPLADIRHIGQYGFVEGGLSAKMSLGARRFSAAVEVYARRTHYEESYCTASATGDACATPVTSSAPFTEDIRGGGRVSVDAWVNRHLRLFAQYDVSSALAMAPEITGYKSLRLVMEGVY